MASSVDVFTVREKEGEEEKRRGAVESRCRRASAGTRVALAGINAATGPRTAAGHEEDEVADRRAPASVGEREEKGRAGEARPSWAAALLGQLAREGRRKEEEEEGWAAAAGREEGEEENEPMKLYPFSDSVFYFLIQMCICLNGFKFKFECMSV
jgi:hypothetical protein